jgi:hypothetical protein
VQDDVAVTGLVEYNNEEDEVQIIGDHEKVDVIKQSIDLLEEVWHKTPVKAEIKDEVGEEECDEVELSAEMEDEAMWMTHKKLGYM